MTKMVHRSDRVRGEYIEVKHPSGLTILLYPMEGYSSAYALFATKYGSIDTCFKTDKDDDFLTIPEGVAHFLEHKLFENEDTDVFELYAKTGAAGNAFTSFDKTAYLFSCTDNFEESLSILLSFVQSPYFTPQTVEKEQGIIGQEIRMYEDNPGWRVFFNLLDALFVKHPVKIDIAGTVESIAQIDADLLYRCYHTFYNLNNMVLAIAGNFDPDAALRVADKELKPAPPLVIENRRVEEPHHINKPEVRQKLEVSMPMFNIGFKGEAPAGTEEIRAIVETEILLDLVVGEASSLYRSLYEEGLINTTFGTEAFSGREYFAAVIGGESRNPMEVFSRVKAEIARVRAEGIDEAVFEGCRKAAYGRYLRSFAHVESVATGLVTAYFGGFGPFDGVEAIANITLADIVARLHNGFDLERAAISIIEPTKAS